MPYQNYNKSSKEKFPWLGQVATTLPYGKEAAAQTMPNKERGVKMGGGRTAKDGVKQMRKLRQRSARVLYMTGQQHTLIMQRIGSL